MLITINNLSILLAKITYFFVINFAKGTAIKVLGAVDLSSLFLRQFVGYLYKAELM